MLGDMRGFFESGVELLNMHHWKSWYHEPVVQMSMATQFCGYVPSNNSDPSIRVSRSQRTNYIEYSDCFLQRITFGEDTVLSIGYSIAIYRQGLANIDLDRMEKTWGQVYGDQDPQYDFVIGPPRDKVPDEDRKTYFLKATEVSNGVMKQLYLWKGNGEAGELASLRSAQAAAAVVLNAKIASTRT
jgi:hypothetical protein